MRSKKWLTGLALGLAVCPPAMSDDTEIYLSTGQNNAVGAPMVMFSMDYRANLTAVTGDKGCAVTGVGTPDGDGVYDENDYPTCPQARYFANQGLAADLPAAGDKFYFFDTLRLALKVVLQEVHGVKIGLMFSHNHETNAAGPTSGSGANGGNRKSNGAAVLMGFQLIEDGNTNPNHAARQTIFNKLTALKELKLLPNSPDQNYQGKELFFEFFRYLTGQNVYNGHNGWVDFEQGNDIQRNTNMRCSDSNPGNLPPLLYNACWDSAAENAAGTQYVSPLAQANQCTKIYTVNFMDQGSLQESDSDNAIAMSKINGGTGAARSTFQDMIQFMHDADLGDGSYGSAPNITGKQNVTSYFVVDNVGTTTNSYATAGGTEKAIPLEGDPAKLVDKLRAIFRQILSVSATFVAASVPVNVFNRAEVLDNIYIALFQAQNRALWPGNLKKVKFKDIANNDFTVIDANSLKAINPNDGRIVQEALTFWTNGAALPAPADPTEIAGRDGRVVTRGGAGQKMPGYLSGGPGATNAGARKLYTEPASFTNGIPSDALLDLNADGTTVTALKSHFTPRPDLSNAQFEGVVLDYLKWLRGLDVRDTDGDNNTSEPRFVTLVDSTDPSASIRQVPWMLADTLHSRPVAINYGARNGHTQANPDIRILVGTNDGFMHMFRNTDSAGGELGVENWAFIPHKLLKLSEWLSEPNISHPYGLDGPAEVLMNDGGDGNIDPGDTVYAYFGLRRGGSAYYALDISNPDLPPKILWKIDQNTSGFGALTFSFSKPTLGTVRYGAAPTSVAIFSAGYDDNKDARPGPGTDDNEGTAVYVVNAQNGSIVKTFTHPDLVDSISSDIVAVDTDGDDHFDRLYFGDTGGRIWRGDMPSASTDNRGSWQLSMLADLGRHNVNNDTNDRRFHHAVDVVQSSDPIGAFDAVVVTSGDREDPKEVTTTNYAFVIKDPNTVSGVVNATQATNLRDDLPITFSELGDVTNNCLQTNSCVVAPDLVRGWKLELRADGEKGLAQPVTLNNIIFFTTYLPNIVNPLTGELASPCEPQEGIGRVYAVALGNATAVYNFDTENDGQPGTDDKGRGDEDRYYDPGYGGIPPSVLPVTPSAVIPPGLGPPLDPGASGKLPIYWYQREDPVRAN